MGNASRVPLQDTPCTKKWVHRLQLHLRHRRQLHPQYRLQRRQHRRTNSWAIASLVPAQANKCSLTVIPTVVVVEHVVMGSLAVPARKCVRKVVKQTLIALLITMVINNPITAPMQLANAFGSSTRLKIAR